MSHTKVDLGSTSVRRYSCEKVSSHDEVIVRENVKDYYGKRLKDSGDLKTDACKFDGKWMTPAVKSALKLIHEEESSK